MARAAPSTADRGDPAPRLVCDVAFAPAMRVRLWQRAATTRVVAPASAHAEVELGWVEYGAARYTVAGRGFDLAAGSALVVPAGVEHATAFPGPLRGGALLLGADRVAEAADAVGLRGARLDAGLLRAPDGVLAVVPVLARELEGAAPGHLAAAEALAEAITVLMLRLGPAREDASRPRALLPLAQPAPARATHPRVAAALDRIHAEYDRALTVEALARDAAMTRFAFTRLFREQVGSAPYQYVLQVRLERAAERLRAGRAGVTEAALDAGFNDLSRFARMFRRRFGCAPSELARAAAAGDAPRTNRLTIRTNRAAPLGRT